MSGFHSCISEAGWVAGSLMNRAFELWPMPFTFIEVHSIILEGSHRLVSLTTQTSQQHPIQWSKH